MLNNKENTTEHAGNTAEKPADIGQLDESFGFLLSKAAQRITDLHAPIFERSGLIPKQFGILTLLHRTDRQSQIEIGRALHIDRSTMVSLVDDLEHKNYVVRARDPRDRRAYAVAVTNKGRTARNKIAAQVAESEAALFSKFTKDRTNELRSILQEITSDWAG